MLGQATEVPEEGGREAGGGHLSSRSCWLGPRLGTSPRQEHLGAVKEAASGLLTPR